MVSRVTGFARIAVIAAVLGPTYLGSLFLAITFLPVLALQFLAGSLIGSLLIPSLVSCIDRRDREATDEIVGGFLGVALIGFGAVALLAIIAAPVIVGILTLGVEDRAAASDQMRIGWLLMALTMPQLLLYGMAIIGGAVMNAHGQFRLAAFAPVVENTGVMAVMVAVAVVYGGGADIGSLPTGQLLLLGLGSTGAVALHAGLVMWGARRAGPRMVPRLGWRIPAVRVLLRRLAASLGQSGFAALRLFAMLALANTVIGGVVALRLALNFLYLPVQVGARPVALTMLPTLARLHEAGEADSLRDEYTRGVALVCFIAVPAAVAYLALARPLADALSFGAMAGSAGPSLVAACLAGLAVAVVAESAFQFFTYVSYARNDARSPFVATVAGTAITLAALPLALILNGGAALLAIGLAMSAGASFSAWYLRRRLVDRLPSAHVSAAQSVLRTSAASAAMAAPAYLSAVSVAAAVDGPLGAALGVLSAAILGIATFVALQRYWDSPELMFFSRGLRRLGER